MIQWFMHLSGLQWLTLAVALQLVIFLCDFILWRNHLKYHRLQDEHTRRLLALVIGRMTAIELMVQVHATRVDHDYRDRTQQRLGKTPREPS